MSLLGAAEIDPRTNGGVLMAVGVGILALEFWGWWAWRRRRKPVFSPNASAGPWKFIDLFLIVVVYFGVFTLLASIWMSLSPAAKDAIQNLEGEKTLAHSLVQLMEQTHGGGLVVCAISALVAAPLAEEFFFRVLLQGWLEKLEWRGRRRFSLLKRRLPRGVLPVALSATAFALPHFRLERTTSPESDLMGLLLLNAVAQLVALVSAWTWVRRVRGATVQELGWMPQRFLGDAGKGLLVFAAVFLPILLIMTGANLLLPKTVAPDPVPLFFLALVLGTYYYATHRVIPVIAIHLAVNGTTFLQILWCLYHAIPLT